MDKSNQINEAMVQANTDKAQSGNDFQNSVFDKIFQIIGNNAIMKNKVMYDVEIVYRQKRTETDIEIIFPTKDGFKVIVETTKSMRNDRDNDKDIKAQAIIRCHKKHNIEVLYAVVVKDDNAYTGDNANNEISMNDRIAKEINEQRIITPERDDCIHLFLRESEVYDCIEYIKENLHKDKITLIEDCRTLIRENKRKERSFADAPEQMSIFDMV